MRNFRHDFVRMAMINFISIFNINSYVIWSDKNLRRISECRRFKGNNLYQVIFIVNLLLFFTAVKIRFCPNVSSWFSQYTFLLRDSILHALRVSTSPAAAGSEIWNNSVFATTSTSKNHLHKQAACLPCTLCATFSPSSVPPRPCTFPIAFSPCVYIHTRVYTAICVVSVRRHVH